MSWKRKSEDEVIILKKNILRESRNPKTAAIYAGTGTIMSFLALSYIPTDLGPPDPPGASWLGLIISTVCGVGIFALMYLMQVWQKRNIGNEVNFRICKQCNEIDHVGNKNCECGGELEPSDYYTHT